MSILYELNNVKKSYDGRAVLIIKHLTLESNQIFGFFGQIFRILEGSRFLVNFCPRQF